MPGPAVLLLSSLFACSADSHDRFFAYYTQLEVAEQVDKISGPYADMVVNLSADGQLIFSREHSYRPVWVYGDEDMAPVPYLSEVREDGSSGRFDASSQYTFTRILEQSDDIITVHWRYFPDLDDLSPTGVVHEVYTIHRDGRVIRTHRAGTASYADWVDPLNQTTQTFRLTQRGLSDIQTTAPSLSPSPSPTLGNPIIPPAELGVDPVASWDFDAGGGDTAAGDPIQAPLWKAGVSGTALAFDGYHTVVDVLEPPAISDAVTVSAWVALGALPWNSAPILQHADDFGAEGYYVGIDPHGRPTVEAGGQSLVADVVLPRNRWTHVAAAIGAGEMALFVDGLPVASVPFTAALSISDRPLTIGLNTDSIEASDGVRGDEVDTYHHFSSVFGVEGLIDEITVYDVALSAESIAALHAGSAPAAAIRSNPDLDARRLPVLNTDGARFGASHTRLVYHDLWDRLWRVTDSEDVVVRFDNAPTAFVYWRGTTHGMNAVTEGLWMADQSVEIIIPDEEEGAQTVTLSEHMSDKQALRSHVRVLESTDARVMVHWRYGIADVFGELVSRNAFVDEVHTIYPDRVAIRDVYYHNSDIGQGREFYHDFQWLVEPDADPIDMMDLGAVSLADLGGATQEVTWPLEAGRDGEARPLDGNIAVINTHTDWKVFGIAQGGGFYAAAGGAEISPYVDWDGADFPFAGPWNHWPVAQIPSDGRYATAGDRVSHFAVGSLESFDHGTGAMMVGFTRSDAASLVPLARSWRQAPQAQRLRGLRGGEYNINRRAYTFRRAMGGDTLSFTLEASASSPLVNPCFVVQRWNSDQSVNLLHDGAPVESLRQGITVDTDGNRMLVLWAELNASHESVFEIRID